MPSESTPLQTGNSRYCELCGFPGPMVPWGKLQGMMSCPQCSLIFFQGTVDPAALYGNSYFTGDEYIDYQADRSVLERNFRARIQELRTYQPSGKLLEIGSAYGYFLNLARHDWEVEGIDITVEGVRFAHSRLGLNVACTDFLSLPDRTGAYDVICLWDTIEHVSQPVHFIQKASRWLKPGGILALTTGDVGSVVARLQKDRWRLIHPPTHLTYFSRATLCRAMENAGLRVEKTSYVGYTRSWKNIVHGLFKGNRWLTLGGCLNFPVYANLFDILLVVARKPRV